VPYIPERDRDRNREYLRNYRADPVNREKINSRKREWRQKPEVQERERAQRRALRWKYYHHLTPEQVGEQLDAQGGRCYLCGTGLLLADIEIEHDHRCCPKNRSCPACRRGLACHFCNKIASFSGDDPALLRQIADALEAAMARVTERMSNGDATGQR
jgi:Recombination endonuclease VII